DRGVPHDRADERPDRGHKPVDQAGETRGLRLPEPRELPSPGKVALHPAHPPISSEEPDGARLKSKSRVRTTDASFARSPSVRVRAIGTRRSHRGSSPTTTDTASAEHTSAASIPGLRSATSVTG